MPIVVPYRIKVKLLPLKELVPHEEIIPEKVAELRESIVKEKIIKKPIIVEERTLTIIDGHHRYTVLRLLGAKLAPVIPARYSRDIESIKAKPRILRLTTIDRYRALAEIVDEIESTTKKGPARILLRTVNEEIVIRRDLKDAYQAVKNLEKKVDNSDSKVVEVKLILPPLSSKEVLKAAMQGELLPPKTTIHQTKLKKMYAGIKLKHLFY